MAEEQREIPHANYLSLGSKDTMATSLTKKTERKSICLFGKTIFPVERKSICLFGKTIFPVESSSLESDETAMPLVDVPISSEKERDDEYLKTLSSFEVELQSSKTRIMKDLTEDARKFKKMRSLSKYEKRARVLTEPPPPPWTIAKTLTGSDISNLSRLMLDTKNAETHIIRHLPADVQNNIQKGIGFNLKAYDHETGTEHDLVLKRHVKTSKSYVLNGGWASGFVKRKTLHEGDRIGLFWGNTDSRLHVCVLQRKQI